MIVCLLGPNAWAQEANTAVVEGYVFDVKTLKPLSSVNVVLSQTSMNGGVRGIGVTTDANGFYSIPVFPADSQISNVLQANCTTRRGNVQSSSTLFPTLLTDRVYQRNFYLTLPRNVSRCTQ